jgi:hypothetical protein
VTVVLIGAAGDLGPDSSDISMQLVSRSLVKPHYWIQVRLHVSDLDGFYADPS